MDFFFHIPFMLTPSDALIVATLLLAVGWLLVLIWKKSHEKRHKLGKKISARVKWWRWRWEQLRYPAKGHRFVRSPKATADMLLKMQRHYTDSDYQPHAFNAPQLSERELLQRDIEKMGEKQPKRRKKHEEPPPQSDDDDIPVDTGSYDIAQFEEFYKKEFHVDSDPENNNH
ncbi:MAG: hypothetical protein LBK47_06705 [Prevotellaceae bacterium]|jgi:hypothetical protein|nr:hypothetical protein [Prevotellaceae bacterium]